MTKANWIDVSYFQDPEKFDYQAAKQAGIQGLIIRAGYGKTQDTAAAQHIANAQKYGFMWHLYHYWYNMDGEAEWAVQNAKSLGLTANQYLFLDMEDKSLPADWNGQFAVFRKAVGGTYKVGLYCSDSPYKAKFQDSQLKQLNVARWIASYSYEPANYDIWQLSGAGGGGFGSYTGDVDRDYTKSNILSLYATANINPVVVQPTADLQYIQPIMLQPGYDTETNIYGLGYSPDNGVHFYVTYTTFGRKYRQEDADRLWPYLKGLASKQPSDAVDNMWTQIKPKVGTMVAQYYADATNSIEPLSSEYATQALADLLNATQNNDFTSFDKKWAYAGTDLGFNYSPTATTFKIWSPTATSVKLISYGTNTNPTAAQSSAISMIRGTSATPDNHVTNTIGVWTLTVPGNQNGMVYAYELTFANGTVSDYSGPTYGTLSTSPVINTTNDPYSIATTQGGYRSVVVSPASVMSNLTLAQGESATWRVASPTQAIVGELHIRDFTISSTSGVLAGNRGKYLGVIQPGTTNPNTGTATGLDYLKNVGFNYVQIMPTSQYSSVDESGNRTSNKPNNYNWGYDPQNVMVPEGEYASDSVNPVTRIIEMKEMVQGLHTNGIGVIMDVVLNHVFWQPESAFEKSQPGYYFRRYSQSGCGNDTASDHEMFGKFIIDAVTYWAKNYDIDGFRFDLMSLLDSTTMNKLRAELTAIDPHIIMYGEGWSDSNENNISETSLNNYKNVSAGIGFFNSSERDAIVNNNGTADGFASGNTASTTKVARALLASAGWNGNDALQAFWTPKQSVNYVECHDGLTLNDKLWSANPNDSVDTHKTRVAFANATNILANGVTFMEIGQEFGRSKLVNPSNLMPLSPTQTQAYQSGSMQKPAWYSASWDTAKNSYNGLFCLDSNGNYHGNYDTGSNLGTLVVAGDVVNGINWDNVKDNQYNVNLISNLIKFKKSNPQFWPDNYTQLALSPTSTGVENVTNASSGVITEELASGSAKYLVVLNASGNSVKIGQGGHFYGGTNFTGKTVIISNDSGLTANQVLNSSVTLPNLTATIIQLS